MSASSTPSLARRHDMDALRAFAMLIGIALHASLAFFPIPWPVQDTQQSGLFGLFFAAVHGFRMPVFFVMSGFFTAMLWRRRSLGGLLVHRARRIALPLLLALITIVPATNWVIRRAVLGAPESETAPAPEITPLNLAVIGGRLDAVESLLAGGADPSAPNQDGSTPLHTAAFFGHSEIFARLLEAGADTEARNGYGHTPAQVTAADWKTTQYIAALIGVEVDREQVDAGRERVIEILAAHMAAAGEAPDGSVLSRTMSSLMEKPVFHHLWFLWFLCWLVGGFAIYALLAQRFGWSGLPAWMMLSPLRYAWLIPLTVLPQLFMGIEPASYGADLSAGWIPKPAVLAFYAIFFGFGVLYFESGDDRGRAGRRWWMTLPVGLFLLFPLGLEFSVGVTGLRDALAPAEQQRLIAVVLQAAYPWVMTFGLMGLFRRLLSRPRASIRYFSDASYWLYLAHLPLVIAAQDLLQGWDAPALAKFGAVTGGVTLVLLAAYQLVVRDRWIGWLLRGTKPVVAVEEGAPTRRAMRRAI